MRYPLLCYHIITYHNIHGDVCVLRAFERTVVTVVLNHALQTMSETQLPVLYMKTIKMQCSAKLASQLRYPYSGVAKKLYENDKLCCLHTDATNDAAWLFAVMKVARGV